MSSDGEIQDVTNANAKTILDLTPILCHARATATRLRLKPFPCFDVLELFAFVRPGQVCLPTINGLVTAIGLKQPHSMNDEALSLVDIVQTLLQDVTQLKKSSSSNALGIAHVLNHAGWCWGPTVLAAAHNQSGESGLGLSALRVWSRLEPFEDRAPPQPPGNEPVTEEESGDRLKKILGKDSEKRKSQEQFSRDVSHAFRAKQAPDEPNLVIAEAGTGVGKTLGYLAPASLWAEKNAGPVWVSTFTRNLQRQLEQELDQVFPIPEDKNERVVIRKGRENYFCLLNYEEALNRAGTDPNSVIPLSLIARWITATRSGDMAGGDFPNWLSDLFGTNRVMSLADRRGECIFSACPHYRCCFVEKTIRKARTADIVVANHALVMVQASLGGVDDATQPMRYIFDEGHHLFGAADSAFSAGLSAMETSDLRMWLIGAEAGGRSSRARGLKRRLSDVLESLDGDNETLATSLDAVLQAARSLPAPGWRTRLEDGEPRGPTEIFLNHVRTQVYARTDPESPYSLQTDSIEFIEGLLDAAATLRSALDRLLKPLKRLIQVLSVQLERPADELDSSTRTRIDGLCRSMELRARVPLTAWCDMLDALSHQTPDEFVDWFGVDRIGGRDTDVGFYRHWVDPTLPFARTVLDPAQGVVVTSASLKDATGDDENDWLCAEQQIGAHHVAGNLTRSALPSPFDYGNATRVYIVTDVNKNSLVHVANAYRDLFLASNGGALGLFTAIARLQATYDQIEPALEAAGIPLYAQHIEPLPTSTLVDIFREEDNTCLLGTDAVRDGVDVPGSALRLMVFDRVPWPRPDILHRARREAFGRKTYDDRITRMRLKQAFGRLIRREGDRGVFVLLDSMMPSRLLGAFPEATPVERLELAEVVKKTKAFFDKFD